MTVAVQELREALVEALGEDARVSDGDSERDLHAADITFHRPQRPDLVVYPSSTDEVSRVLAIAERAPRAGDAVRRRLEPRGPRDPDAWRHQPRSLPHEPDRRDRPGGSQRDRPGGRDADGARARGRRVRPLLPGRSRCGRDARRHGGDECGRDDDDPLREDARQRPRRSRRCSPTGRSSEPAAGRGRRPPATTSRACSSGPKGRSP